VKTVYTAIPHILVLFYGTVIKSFLEISPLKIVTDEGRRVSLNIVNLEFTGNKHADKLDIQQ